jgi:hypothetical protein
MTECVVGNSGRPTDARLDLVSVPPGRRQEAETGAPAKPAPLEDVKKVSTQYTKDRSDSCAWTNAPPSMADSGVSASKRKTGVQR